jgi:hypothetical protein
VNEEGPATQAGRLRLDETEHGLHRNRRINSGTSRSQHLDTRIHSEWVGSGD